MARLQEWTLEVVEKITTKMNKYTESSTLPRLAEFCYENDISREYLYELIKTVKIGNYVNQTPEFTEAINELSYSIKKMFLKKESQLEMGGLLNKFNSGITAFSLKQLGWSDKQEINTNITFNKDEAKNELREFFG